MSRLSRKCGNLDVSQPKWASTAYYRDSLNFTQKQVNVCDGLELNPWPPQAGSHHLVKSYAMAKAGQEEKIEMAKELPVLSTSLNLFPLPWTRYLQAQAMLEQTAGMEDFRITPIPTTDHIYRVLAFLNTAGIAQSV
jgi:hypothetical protein